MSKKENIKKEVIKKEIKTKIDLNDFLKQARINTKKVILPNSLLEIEIKKISQKDWLYKTNNLFFISNGRGNVDTEELLQNEESRKKLEEMTFNILNIGCVNPKLTNTDTFIDGELFYEYLPISDINFLTNEIMTFSGLKETPSNI